jgi:hypothetical protein
MRKQKIERGKLREVVRVGTRLYDTEDKKTRTVSKISRAGGWLFYMTDGTLENADNIVKYYQLVK